MCAADQRLCFCYIVIAIPLLISSRQRSSEAAQPGVCISRGAAHIIKPLHEIHVGYCTLHISGQRWLGRADFGRKLGFYIVLKYALQIVYPKFQVSSHRLLL